MPDALFAIDPGETQSAIVSWDGTSIGTAIILPNEGLLRLLTNSHNLLNGRIVAIERLSCYGQRVGREVFRTCEWIGEFANAARMAGAIAHRIERRKVVEHFGITGKGKDAAVIAVLKSRFGEKGTKATQGVTYKLSSHLWQAFALAVMVFDSNNVEPSPRNSPAT